ncbi:MAG: hypothetical protein D6826_08280 [Alphaproteobacteria bacterium]|nr:MAG: hypothetical protein D6826_08280 [Alphaproteobacteria bacterium]
MPAVTRALDVVVEFQKVELDRLVHENERLNRRLDEQFAEMRHLRELLQREQVLRQQEQSLRQQLQEILEHLTRRPVLSAPATRVDARTEQGEQTGRVAQPEAAQTRPEASRAEDTASGSPQEGADGDPFRVVLRAATHHPQTPPHTAPPDDGSPLRYAPETTEPDRAGPGTGPPPPLHPGSSPPSADLSGNETSPEPAAPGAVAPPTRPVPAPPSAGVAPSPPPPTPAAGAAEEGPAPKAQELADILRDIGAALRDVERDRDAAAVSQGAPFSSSSLSSPPEEDLSPAEIERRNAARMMRRLLRGRVPPRPNQD